MKAEEKQKQINDYKYRTTFSKFNKEESTMNLLQKLPKKLK